MTFQLQLLINTGDYPRYPYVGISPDTARVVLLCGEHIGILPREDSTYFENDYMATSRYFDLDLEKIDDLVKKYTGQEEYNILTRFGPHKHITLTYHSPTNEAPKNYDIFATYPDPRAQQLVRDLYPLIAGIRDAVGRMD